jgi:hypothetical protein
MATRRKMNYQIKKAYLGKVRLEDGHGSTTLDEKTPQDVLVKLFGTVLGKGFIEPVPATVVAAPQPKDNGKAGQ